MTAPVPPEVRSNSRKRLLLMVMEPSLRSLFTNVPPRYDVVEPGWDELDETLRRASPSSIVVVDPYAGEPAGARLPLVRDLLKRFPSVPVLAVMDLRPEVQGDVQMLLDWGVAEVAPLGPFRTPGVMRHVLWQAHARPFKRRLEAVLNSYVGADARGLLRAAAEVAVEGGQAPELAQRLGVSARTLTARCLRAGLPAPRHTQAWIRLLLGCMLLDDPGRTVYSAAYASGYASERSLRRAITASLGLDSTALRRAGAFATAGAAFNHALHQAREAARERRRPGPHRKAE